MSLFHGERVLECLHDQYLRQIDCDVVLTAANHLEELSPEVSGSNASSQPEKVWTSFACHKNVIRASSSYFDRIFSQKFKFEKVDVESDVEGVLLHDDTNHKIVLQITHSGISSHSLRAMIDFAYTGSFEVETHVLKRVINDLNILNLLPMINVLGSRLDENLCYTNCLSNFIISYSLERKDSFVKIAKFILNEFFSGLKHGPYEGPWVHYFGESELSLSELNSKVVSDLQTETECIVERGISEDQELVSIILELIQEHSLCGSKEIKFSSFLMTKEKEKCSVHLEDIIMHCYTDGQNVCLECLNDAHSEHRLQPFKKAKHNRLVPHWERLDSELEHVKQGSKDRITCLDGLMHDILDEKSRDVKILKSCAEIKPRMDDLSNKFQSGKLDFYDKDIFAFEQFLSTMKAESRRLEADFDRARRVSEDLVNFIQMRCNSCSSIADTISEINGPRLFENVDLDQPLTTENCIRILNKSESVNNQQIQIYDKVFNFILHNFKDVVKDCGETFYRLTSHRVLLNLLKSDMLNVTTEDFVVRILLKWLKFDTMQREKLAGQLFQGIRFGSVSQTMLQEMRDDRTLMSLVNPKLKQFINNAIMGKCLLNPRNSTLTKIFVFGDSGKNMKYDTIKGKWEEWRGQNNGEMFECARVGDNIYVIGGVKDGATASKVSIYNVTTNSWKSGPSMLEARWGCASCVSSENAIYVLGGCDVNEHAVCSVEMLQCDEHGKAVGGWQSLSPMTKARACHEAVIIDNKIYAIGGLPDLETVEMFDIKQSCWKSCKSMLKGKHGHSTATYNKEIYALGRDGFFEKYNTLTDTWSPLAALQSSALSRAVVTLDEKIYFLGGNGCEELDIYDIETDSWSKGPHMPNMIGRTKCVRWL